MTAPVLLRGDARTLPLADESVDLVVTSPPYFGLRDYGVDGQIGAEPTPADFLDALLACTREMARVLKPSGSIFVNLGDKYGRPGGGADRSPRTLDGAGRGTATRPATPARAGGVQKSLLLLPERYRIACADDLGLIVRAVILWDKPNGLPESVTDRVRRSHEDWVHLTKQPRYFAAVDEIRETHTMRAQRRYSGRPEDRTPRPNTHPPRTYTPALSDKPIVDGHPLGKLPGSVWTVPSQPLHVPADLGVDHFAAFPMEWPRRLINGWCPREVCTTCGQGRAPVVQAGTTGHDNNDAPGRSHSTMALQGSAFYRFRAENPRTITGYRCACPDTSAPSTPGVVLDPFGGTGTTALVAAMLGRRGISVDLNPDYLRIAEWRTNDPKERARAAGLDPDQVAALRDELPGQLDLLADATA